MCNDAIAATKTKFNTQPSIGNYIDTVFPFLIPCWTTMVLWLASSVPSWTHLVCTYMFGWARAHSYCRCPQLHCWLCYHHQCPLHGNIELARHSAGGAFAIDLGVALCELTITFKDWMVHPRKFYMPQWEIENKLLVPQLIIRSTSEGYRCEERNTADWFFQGVGQG